MNKLVKSTLTLVLICSVMALLLGVTNAITAPIIEANANDKSNAALLEVFPNGEGFEKIDITTYDLPETVSEVYKENSGGYVVKLVTNGYSSGLVIMCGISADGKVIGTKVIENTETPSIGGAAISKYESDGVFKDKTINDIDGVDTVGGATKTTAAYVKAVKDALGAAVIVSGGSVDLRTEEEILADSLAEALPAANGEFEKVFFATEITAFDALYKAKNGAGYVAKAGEQFIVLSAEGNVVTEGISAEISDAVSADAKKQINITYENIDLSAYEKGVIPSSVTSAKKTSEGNYVLELRASGYAIKHNYSGEPNETRYIKIMLSVTGEGKIIDCLTISHKESEGYGDKCATEAFYNQVEGKTEANYNDIIIAGATETTKGYKAALKNAFAVIKVFEGGSGE